MPLIQDRIAVSVETIMLATDFSPAALLFTPPHPEYPSNHSFVSAAGATILAHYFGSNSSFSVDSDVMTGVVRSFPSFSAALAEIADARVFGGIHFRNSCEVGQATGTQVAEYVLRHAFRRDPREGREEEN
jgi:PAP2 superfamily